MGLKHLGYALDVALVGLSGYLLSQAPLSADLLRDGAAALYRLPDGPAYNASPAGAQLFADPVQQKWFDFMLGDNLGYYAKTNSIAAEFHGWDAWLNTLILPLAVREALPHVLAIWLRNCIAGWILYYVVSGLWSFVIYIAMKDYFFPGKKAAEIPSWEDMKLQMQVSTQAMVLYSIMPTLGEWFIERGLTKVGVHPCLLKGCVVAERHNPARAPLWRKRTLMSSGPRAS